MTCSATAAEFPRAHIARCLTLRARSIAGSSRVPAPTGDVVLMSASFVRADMIAGVETRR